MHLFAQYQRYLSWYPDNRKGTKMLTEQLSINQRFSQHSWAGTWKKGTLWLSGLWFFKWACVFTYLGYKISTACLQMAMALKRLCLCACSSKHSPASVSQLDASSDWRPGGRGFNPAEVGNILSWRLIMKYFLRSFSPFRWFKKGSCQFLAKECAQYWLTA